MGFYRRLSVSESLATAVLGADYSTPRKLRPVERKGPAPADAPRRPAPAPAESDNVLLEIRRLREQCGLSVPQIKGQLALMGVHVERERVRHICEYTTRSHLVPAANALPYLERKTP